MNHPTLLEGGDKLIVRGIHLSLTEAMKSAISSKVERLLRHEPKIVRVRIDVEPMRIEHHRVFTAKGQVQVSGPDLCVSAIHEDAYHAIDDLIDKLDRQLRKRATASSRNRGQEDIRGYVADTPADDV
jgi:putative sigma-54 modulation protein